MAEDIVLVAGAPLRLELLDGPAVEPLSATFLGYAAGDLRIELPAGIALPVGMPVHGEVAIDDGVYAFDTWCRTAGETAGVCELAAPETIERLQRRASARVPDALTVSLILNTDGRIQTISSTTIDVSVGGVSLVAPQSVAGAVTVVLVVPDGEGGRPLRLHLDGEVRRCVPNGERTFQVAVAFTELADAEEQVLSQHLFRRMREIRRARVGR